jgi:hypothetical protein
VRKLGCLTFVLLLLVGLLGLLDVFARTYTERTIAEAIQHRSGGRVGAASVSISSVPYLWRLVGQGYIDHIDVSMTELKVTQPIDAVDVHIDGLHMDRNALLGESHVEIKAVDQVSVSVLVSASRLQTLADGLGVQLSFEDGSVRVGGQRLDVSVDGGLLTVAGAGLDGVAVPIPAGDAEVLPCQPSVAVHAEGVRLTCSTDRVPKLLLDAIGSPALQQLTG